MSTSKWGTSTKTYADNISEFQELVLTGRLGGEPYLTVRSSDNRVLPDFTPRVLRGMDLMDTHLPGWHLALDFTTLDLESDQQCVLGQTWPLYASATGAVPALGATEYQRFSAYILDTNLGSEGAAEYGFALSNRDFVLVNTYAFNESPTETDEIALYSAATRWTNRFFEQLTRTWIIQITAARAAGRWPTPTSPAASVPEPTPVLS